MHDPKLAHMWAYQFLSQLKALGVEHVCVAPGSRSTVLTIQASRVFEDATTVHYDERGLGFYALGSAKSSHKPTCIITTSGTAVANLLPAVIEAHYSRVPLIIISADRPPELRDRGSNQTIDQDRLYGRHVGWYFEVPCATPDISLDLVGDWALQAWEHSIDGQPVHLNWMFREPFVSGDSDADVTPKEMLVSRVARPRFSAHSDLSSLRDILESSERGVCVVGELRSREDSAFVREFVRSLGWATFADSLSQLRGDTGIPSLVTYGDLALLTETPADRYPDTVLFLGGRVTSKRISTLLQARTHTRVVALSSEREHVDPGCGVSQSFVSSYEALTNFCSTLRNNKAKNFAEYFVARSEAVAGVLERELPCDSGSTLSEPGVVRKIAQLVPSNQMLFLGNSMPIRDFEMFAPARSEAPPVFANRGASGIDGVVATALGAAHASDSDCTLVIGDLSLLHDLNSLALAREMNRSVTIVVINNDGGGIFSLLSVATQPSFERYFATPHGLVFAEFARGFGLSYAHPETLGQFEQAYTQSLRRKGASIIEVTTNRASNAELHRTLSAAIRASPR